MEGANIPAKPEMEKRLHGRCILVVPDFVANAGGVISSYAEYKGLKPKNMFAIVEKKIRKNTKLILEEARKNDMLPREAAMQIAQKRVRDAMKKRE